MTGRKNRLPVSPITVGAAEAAAMLGVSDDHFERHIASELKVIRCGRRKLWLVSELHSWAEQRAARTL